MSYNAPPRGDINRLPKWAQEYIASLKREIDQQDNHIKEISAQHPGSNVVLDSSRGRPDVTLPPDSRIRFYVGEGRDGFDNAFEVNHHHQDPSLLRVSAYSMGSFAIIPYVSNVVYLKPEGH